jgi:hypothetical protein
MTDTIRIKRNLHGKENPYFMMTRATAQDRELSWEARGVLCYLLSKPDDWKLQPTDLEQGCAKGRVYRILDELIETGYIERVQQRDENTGQIRSWDYLVYESPLPRFPEVGLPEVENRDAYIVETVQNTDFTEKDLAATSAAEGKHPAVSPSLPATKHQPPRIPGRIGVRSEALEPDEETSPKVSELEQMVIATIRSFGGNAKAFNATQRKTSGQVGISVKGVIGTLPPPAHYYETSELYRRWAKDLIETRCRVLANNGALLSRDNAISLLKAEHGHFLKLEEMARAYNHYKRYFEPHADIQEEHNGILYYNGRIVKGQNVLEDTPRTIWEANGLSDDDLRRILELRNSGMLL